MTLITAFAKSCLALRSPCWISLFAHLVVGSHLRLTPLWWELHLCHQGKATQPTEKQSKPTPATFPSPEEVPVPGIDRNAPTWKLNSSYNSDWEDQATLMDEQEKHLVPSLLSPIYLFILWSIEHNLVLQLQVWEKLTSRGTLPKIKSKEDHHNLEKT